LEDFTRDEVVARGSFGRKVVDDCLNFGLFESVEGGIRVGKGIPKDGSGVPPHQVSWWGVAGKQMLNGWRRHELWRYWYMPKCLELFEVGG
jgi:hypothetical protein